MQKEEISVGKVMNQCAMALLAVFGILAALILIPVRLDKWEQAKTIEQLREKTAVYLDEKYPGHDFRGKRIMSRRLKGMW